MQKSHLATCVSTILFTSTALLTGCGGDSDSSSSNKVTDNRLESDSYYFTVTQNGNIESGVGQYTIKVEAKDGSDLSGEALTVSPVMTMMSGMVHSTPITTGDGLLDENGELDATHYYLMQSGEMGSWELKLTLNEETVTQDIDINWEGSGHVTLSGGDDDQVMNMSGEGTTSRSYYVYKKDIHTMGDMQHLTIFVGARESMMNYKAVNTGSTLTGGMNDLGINEVSVSLCVRECDEAGNWITDGVTELENGLYEAMIMGTEAPESISVSLSINSSKKTSGMGDMQMNYATLDLSGNSTDEAMDHSDHMGDMNGQN